jgi:predicted hotdog family 3-hydroxylacyl-ACP dehydratase
MMDPSAIPIGELVPHGPEMTVIDRLVTHTPERSVATVSVTERSPFVAGSGAPAWVGIEYMAQTIAARAGFEARQRGEPPAIGYLLGTRAYRSSLPEFPVGSTLTIVIEPVVVDEKVGVFQCSIAADRVIATAVVNTYQPAGAELEGIRSGAPRP